MPGRGLTRRKKRKKRREEKGALGGLPMPGGGEIDRQGSWGGGGSQEGKIVGGVGGGLSTPPQRNVVLAVGDKKRWWWVVRWGTLVSKLATKGCGFTCGGGVIRKETEGGGGCAGKRIDIEQKEGWTRMPSGRPNGNAPGRGESNVKMAVPGGGAHLERWMSVTRTLRILEEFSHAGSPYSELKKGCGWVRGSGLGVGGCGGGP